MTIQKHHSRLGIASLIIALIMPGLLICLFALGALLNTRQGTIGKWVIGAWFVIGLCGPLIHLGGLILGLSGLVSKTTKKHFAIAGSAMNLLLGILGVGIIYFIITNISYGFR